MNRFGWLALVGLTLVLGVGCGGDNRATISGKVSLDGVVVESGSISFTPEAGTTSPSAGAEITNGVYKTAAGKGPTPGTFMVKIHWPRKTGKKIQAPSPAPPGTFVEESEEAMPPKYNHESTLKAEVMAGVNTLDYELKSK